MAKQLVQPNFEIIENAGWCLQYARRVFGAPAVESTAWQGWMMTEHPHEDRNFPADVAVPVWFDWKGDVGDGHVFRYGHVAVRAADGKIWSSPLAGRGSAWFNTVDDLTRAFGGGMKYVGWSEDISNVKVVQLQEEETMTPYALNLLAQIGWNRPVNASDKFVADYTGKDIEATLEDVLKSKENLMLRTKAANYDKQIEVKDAQIAMLKSQTMPSSVMYDEVTEKLYRKK